jgi:hypothetical protein
MIKMADKKQLRTFGIGLTVLLMIIGLIQFLKGNTPIYQYFVGASLVMLITTLLIPTAIRPIYSGAMFISHVLGWINTRLILGLLFFLVFTPISWIFKIMGKDPLERKFDKKAPSYWKTREITNFDKSRCEKQF